MNKMFDLMNFLFGSSVGTYNKISKAKLECCAGSDVVGVNYRLLSEGQM